MQGATNPNDVLRAILQLEYFASVFYETALVTTYASPLLPEERTVLTQIAAHQRGHITTLRGLLGSAAPTEPAAASYDFSGGKGTWCGPFRGAVGAAATTSPAGDAVSATDPDKYDCLKLARLIEDLSARAYIGCIPAMNGSTHVPTLFEMVAAEGLHAGAVRGLMLSYNNSGVYEDPVTITDPFITYWVSSSGTSAGAFSYSVNAYTTTRVYPDGLTQRDIANGVATVVIGENNFREVTIVQPGVYGPGFAAPAQGGTERSPGEDNIMVSSSMATNITSTNAKVFDEPMATDAVQSILALFGAA